MSLWGFVLLLLIAAVAGALGQAISGYSLGGCLISIVVGFLGAYIGMWIAQQFGLPSIVPINIEGEVFPFVWSVLGSALLSAILGLILRNTNRVAV